MSKLSLTAEKLRTWLLYEPDTGEWYWRVKMSNRIKAGMEAGTIRSDGYRRILINGCHHYSGQLAFLYMTGEWPEDQVDHENRIRSDDRWDNLREANWSQNMANRNMPSHNTSGFTGISWRKASNKWEARVNNVHLGLFDDIDEAISARDFWALNGKETSLISI